MSRSAPGLVIGGQARLEGADLKEAIPGRSLLRAEQLATKRNRLVRGTVLEEFERRPVLQDRQPPTVLRLVDLTPSEALAE